MSAREQALAGPVIEVVAKATRRRFTAEYKRKIVREADACKTPGAVGALLRRRHWPRVGHTKAHATLAVLGPHFDDELAAAMPDLLEFFALWHPIERSTGACGYR